MARIVGVVEDDETNAMKKRMRNSVSACLENSREMTKRRERQRQK